MKEKLSRILLVHNYYQISGGEDTVVQNEKQLLEEHGHTVFVYKRENQEIHSFSKVRKLGLFFESIFSRRTYREVKRLIQRERIDVVHVHNTLSLISPSVYYAALDCGIPAVQTVHNYRLLCPAATLVKRSRICEDCLQRGLSCAVKGRCYRGSLAQTLVSVLILKVHRLLGTYRKIYYICLTDFNRKKLLQINERGCRQIWPEHVYVKSNFVWPGEAACELPRKDQFLYVGRLDDIKGIRTLVEAWREMGDKELLICGSGPSEAWVKGYLERHHRKQVKLLGQVSHEQVQKLLRESRALIMPTQWYEGQPMVILESYAAGTPVIGSRMGNVKDMIKEGITGITVAPGSPEQLREAILQLPEFDAAVIRRHFEIYYDPEKNYAQLAEIYQKVIEKTNSRRGK